ncbi:restriction endonuclease subunit S [Vibrio vulnificus]|uniref:restriction endonuclease subunit S n=1 Tax=Vibrio vulnificus TaxID=672 RepID=UPI001CDCE8B8|nr:restriction endonuclease subunit S [Vibrio vulnificus]MCA3952540.1 restriction endonuclease subunit S [Vibrio vulnificus]
MSELPKGWVIAKLGSYIHLKNGFAFKSKDYSEPSNMTVPVIRISDINGTVASDEKANHVPTELAVSEFEIAKGDLLVAMSGATTGKIGVYGGRTPAYQNQRVGNLKLNAPELSDLGFRNHLIKYLSPTILEIAYGGAQPNISASGIENIEVCFPPLAEQKRIVEKLDEVLAQVDTIKSRLDGIPALLKRFRQSVLASAVSGKLTEEWRGESGYVFHEEIQAEVPSSWKIETIDDIGSVKGGKRLPKGEELVSTDTGFPYIRAGQLKKGTVIQGTDARNAQMYLEPHVQSQISRYVVSEGDAYITIVGASIGDAGIIPASHSGANLTENAAKICDFQDDVLGQFLGLWLRSQLIQRLIKLEIKSGAQGKLALMRIKTLPFPRAAFEEQKEIVRLVDQYFAFADTIEAQVKKAQARVNNLTQSILAKAFRGELVAQDPNDEPADKLLERIAQARKEAEALAKAAKKAQSTKSTAKKKVAKSA